MKKYLLLIFSFLILSCSGACLKMASMQAFLSLAYIAYFGLTVLVMAVYAVLWQKVLEDIPLNIAYLCKSSTVGISLLYAYMLFGEQITIQNIIGCVMIIAGIMVLSYKKGQTA